MRRIQDTTHITLEWNLIQSCISRLSRAVKKFKLLSTPTLTRFYAHLFRKNEYEISIFESIFMLAFRNSTDTFHCETITDMANYILEQALPSMYFPCLNTKIKK